MKRISIPLCAIAVAVSTHSGPARATHWSNAVEVCQGALHVFEDSLRKRPLAIANEGVAPAFVSCSLATPLLPTQDALAVDVLFNNTTPATVQFSCTLVDGVIFFSPNYLPQAITITAGALFTAHWDTDNNGGDTYDLPSLNCALPPGVEINTLQLTTE